MTEDQYWEAQWLIGWLEQGAYDRGPMTEDEDLCLDFLLSLKKPEIIDAGWCCVEGVVLM